MGKHLLDKMISQHGIEEPAFVFDGNERKPFLERSRKESDSRTTRTTMRIEQVDPLNPTTRRIFLEDIAGQIHIFERLQLSTRIGDQRSRHVPLGRDRDELWLGRTALQPHGLARSTESRLDFGTN